jgi:plasmid maintenance system antidote protein VapI
MTTKTTAKAMTKAMTGSQLKRCLDQIGWTVNQTEQRLAVPGNTLQRMVHDKKQIPEGLAAWVRNIARAIQSLGTPTLE